MAPKKTKTPKSSKTIIEVGGQYRIYSDAVKTHPKLPVGTYEVGFHPAEGHWLTRIVDMKASDEKMYGNGQRRIDRIKAHYAASKRSVGVLMSGRGGMGKTMLMRALTEQVAEEFGLPVVIVSASSPGLARFIDQLDECVVMFDEFEKIFTPSNEHTDSADEQVQFLSLFDGMSSNKRMYIVTVNDLSKVNTYMINRTGRFHYHLQFDYPEPADVAAYLEDAGVKPKQIKKVVAFTTKTQVNYDHLRAIAFDLVVTGAEFGEIIGDLNIRRQSQQIYDIIVTFVGGKTRTQSERLDLFDPTSDLFLYLPIKASKVDENGNDNEHCQITLNNEKAVIGTDDVIVYAGDAIKYFDASKDVHSDYRKIASVELQLHGTPHANYAGLV